MAGTKRSAGKRLAFELLERRDLLAADLSLRYSSALFLASSQDESAGLTSSLDDVAPLASGFSSVAAPPTGFVNHAPDGADKTVTTLEDTSYTFTGADFGFSDQAQWMPDGAAPATSLTPNNVLVLYNTASSAGLQIANYYAQVHPGVHLVGINGVDPASETVTADFYLSTIRPQVLAALTPSIDVIVTTKGLPLRITVTQSSVASYVDPYGTSHTVQQWRPYSSLESELTRVDYVSSWQMMGNQSYNLPGHFDWNPYYLAAGSFDHAATGTRLSARLDAYSVADVLASIDRAQVAYVGPNNQPNGPVYFLVDNDPSKSYWGYMNKVVIDVLNPAGLPLVSDNTSAFVGSAPGPIIFYDSHGVHQASTPANYLLTGLTATLANGAVFESWESFNAYSFDPNSTTHVNQGQVGQWLQIGGTAAVGHVEEPTASSSTVTNENQMVRMLLAGYTFAESAWSANKQLSFVNTVVGDPLMTWGRLASVTHQLAAVKITALPTAGSLTRGGVAVAAGQMISAADIASGMLKFNPAANANGSAYAQFTFQVQDNGGTAGGGVDLDPTPNTITIDVTPVNITPVNDPPAGTSKTVTTLEDTAFTFTAADFGFTDPNDVPANTLLAVKMTTLPPAGTLTDNGLAVTAGQFVPLADITGAKLKFTPAANANGLSYASFTFQVQDNGGTANGGVDLDQSPNTITVNVTSVNDPPAGTNKTVTTLEDTAYTFTTADFGFSDPNDTPANNPLAVKVTTLPAAGSLKDNGVAVAAGQLVTVADITAGLLQYTPAANANGAPYKAFTFQVQDDGGIAGGGINLDASPNTITVNVTSVNDPPAGTNKTVTTLEDTAYTFTAADFGFTDPNDAPANTLLAVKVSTLPVAGSLTDNGVAVTAGQFINLADLTAGLLVFTPAANANGSAYAQFTFQVQDNGGTTGGGVDLDPTPNTITIDVTPADDPSNGFTGAVGWWRFNEAAGGVSSDSSGHNHTATLQAGASLSAGHAGSALYLSASSQRAVVADAADLDITSAITLSAWIAPGKKATQTILKKGRADTVDGYELGLSSGGKAFVRFNQDTSGDTYRVNSTASYPTNGTTWMHVAATYDGATIRLYVNGQLQGSKAATFAIKTNNTALAIGAEDTGTKSMRGKIDDVLVADRALTAAEILGVYQGTLLPAGAVNEAPVVQAPADLATSVGSVLALAGSVTDDGLPAPSAITSTWSTVAGPASAQFANANSPSTTATFSAAGTYLLRLTATDGVLTASDDVTVTVAPAGTAAGVVGRWKFDEGSGTTAGDSSGNNNQGTLLGGANFAAGYSGSGLSLTASSQRVTVNDAPSLDITDAITVSAWIAPKLKDTQTVLKKGRSGSVDGYELSLSSTGKVFVRFNQATSGDTYRLDSTSSYPTNGTTWMHVAATYDGTTIRLYVNGVLQGSKAAVLTIATGNTPLSIGGEDTGVKSMRGTIDDVLVANRALSASEILSLYQGTFA